MGGPKFFGYPEALVFPLRIRKFDESLDDFGYPHFSKPHVDCLPL